MQRSFLLGAGAIVLVAGGFIALRGMTRHQAGVVTDQGIQQLLASLPPGWAVRHGPIDYNPLTTTATLHDVKISRPGQVDWMAETVTVSGADQQALREVFDPSAYPGGKPAWTDRRLLLTDAAAHGVHAHVEGLAPIDYSIGTVTLHRLSGRPFMMPPTPANRADPKFAADAALAFAADSAEETDTKVAEVGGKKSVVTLSQVRLSNYDAGKLGAFAMKELAVDVRDKNGQPVHFAMGSLSVKDLDAARALQSVQQTGQTGNLQPGMVGYSAADMADLGMTVGAAFTLLVGEVHGTLTLPDHNGVRNNTAFVHALTIGLGTIPMPPKAQAAIDAFGMRAITLDIDGNGSGAEGGHSEIDETIALHDLGSLHVSGALSGYVDPRGGAMPAGRAALMAVTLEHASLVWTDASLVDRVVKVAAAQAGTTEEIIRGQMAMPILAVGVMVPDQPDVADQLTAFLTHPHTLTLTMTPPDKVTFADVAKAPATMRAHLIGLRVKGT